MSTNSTMMDGSGRDTLSSCPGLARVRQRASSTRLTLLSSSFEYCQEILPLSRRSAFTDHQQQQQQQKCSWKQRLVHLSNVASILCMIDCTVLPVMTIFLSVLGMAETTASSITMEEPHDATTTTTLTTISSFFPLAWLQTLGHTMAIYFVLPVGCFTTTMNFMTHKRWSITIPAIFGLLMIYVANCHMPHCHHHQLDGHASGITTTASTIMVHDRHLDDHSTIKATSHGMDEEFVDHSALMEDHHRDNARISPADIADYPSAVLLHRFINVMGCMLLLTSNYRSQRLAHSGCQEKECKHGILRSRI